MVGTFALLRFTVFMACGICFGTSDLIEIMALDFVEMLPVAVNITCSPKTVGDIRNLIGIQIIKGKDLQLATVQMSSSTGNYTEVNSVLPADGNIDDNEIANSYLRISIKQPVFTDSDEYTCLVYYVDRKGFIRQEKSSDDLNVSDQDNQLHMKYLFQKTSIQEDLIKMQALKLEEQKQRIESLETQRPITDSHSYFSASINKSHVLETSDVVVFGNVLTTKGQGYDKTTGLFTAPYRGLYAFHLSVYIGGIEDPKPCPEDWTFYGPENYCIKFFKTPTKTWQDARQHCLDIGADLIRIENKKKSDLVGEYSGYHRWIGLHRQKDTDLFHWLDDTTPVKTAFWGDNRPDNWEGIEDCVHAYHGDGKWNDIKCSMKFSYVCEKPHIPLGVDVAIKIGDRYVASATLGSQEDKTNSWSMSCAIALEAGDVVGVFASARSPGLTGSKPSIGHNSVFTGYLVNSLSLNPYIV